MKTNQLSMFIIALVFTSSVFSQVPDGFTYQSVLRDSSGNVLVNENNLQVRFKILSYIDSVYVETHTGVATNEFGLLTLNVGQGLPEYGIFSNIDWETGSEFYLKVEIDFGSGYENMGTNQIFTVPYAMVAMKALSGGGHWSKFSNDIFYDLGDVGIGTTPTEKLHLHEFSAGIDNLIHLTNYSTGAGAPFGMFMGILKTQEAVIRNNQNAPILFGTNGVDRMAISNMGDLGVGTIDPDAKLEVAGQVKITGGSPGSGKVLTSDSSGLATWMAPSGGLWNASASDIYYNTGNVGVGTNSPNYPLDVAVNSANYALRTQNTGSGGGITVYVNTTADNQTVLSATSLAAGGLVVKGDGNVGIGTTTPDTDLEVNGQVQITGGSPGAGKVLTSDAAGLASWETPSYSLWSLSSNDVYYSAGNVGLGTDVPGTILHLKVNSSNMITLDRTDNGIIEDKFQLGVTQGSGGEDILQIRSDSLGFIAGFEKTGNVGIGTTTPDAKLDIAGQIKITGGFPGAGKILTSDNTGLASWQSFGMWSLSASDVYYNSGNVGIGTSVPGTALHIKKNAANILTLDRTDNGIIEDKFYFGITQSGGEDILFISSDAAGTITSFEKTGRVGIGSTDPEDLLEVAGGRVEITSANDATENPGSGVLEIANSLRIDENEIITNTNNPLHLNRDNNGDVIIDNGTLYVDALTNSVGINTNNPNVMLEVWEGQIQIRQDAEIAISMVNDSSDHWGMGLESGENPSDLYLWRGNTRVGGFSHTTGGYSGFSDINRKSDITPLEGTLVKVLQLKPSSYSIKGYESEGRTVGFIAQEVEKLFPESVARSGDFIGLTYSHFSVYAIKAIQEQQEIIDNQQKEIDTLKEQMQGLQQLMAENQ